MQLPRLAGINAYGAASVSKHHTVRSLGATPIDYRAGSIDRLTRALEPAGVDYVFDAIGGSNIGPCIGARLRGRNGKFYGITMLYRKDPCPFREDLPKIFDLLADKKIDPMIVRTFPLLEARQALDFPASGSVEGKIVLTDSAAP